tara:strand:- start:123 stop:305 length:183 start_codon:yes stop_codon:yes gene_type:complete
LARVSSVTPESKMRAAANNKKVNRNASVLLPYKPDEKNIQLKNMNGYRNSVINQDVPPIS